MLQTRAEAQRIVPLYLDLVDDARLLDDRGEFFRSVLDRLSAALTPLGAVRKVRGRVRYWVLTPEPPLGRVIEL